MQTLEIVSGPPPLDVDSSRQFLVRTKRNLTFVVSMFNLEIWTNDDLNQICTVYSIGVPVRIPSITLDPESIVWHAEIKVQ